ncbi:MAG TPA: polysaccharide deacetylase family protein [Gemmatimonadota bacterium]|nr:polysaccharide deacetylase family protein [Gemmatimonadota bacterium]
MRLPGRKSVVQVSRWLRSRSGERALVLGYHRIASPTSDPYSLCVAPERFDEQLDAIRRHARPVGLGELRRALTNDEPLDDAVAITFDDGYADVLTDAVPLLERHRVPATVFVIAGLLGREYWWETLARILAPRRPLPARLRLSLEPDTFEWDSRGDDHDTGRRRELLFALHRRLLPLPDEHRRAALNTLLAWAGADAAEPPSSRSLSPGEVARLARRDLVEVGSHTSTHPVLPDLQDDRQRAEIERSKADLEGLLGRPVLSFSYPHGRSSAETARFVRESGYECACTSRNDMVRRGSDPFDLPRFWVPDWDGARFSRWLGRWLGRSRAEDA